MLLRNKDKPFMSSTGDENIMTILFIIQFIVVNKKWDKKTNEQGIMPSMYMQLIITVSNPKGQ